MAAYDNVPVPKDAVMRYRGREDLGFTSLSSHLRRPSLWHNVAPEEGDTTSRKRAQASIAASIKSMYEAKQARGNNAEWEKDLFTSFGIGEYGIPPISRISQRYTCLHCNCWHAEIRDDRKYDFVWPTHNRAYGGATACKGSGLKLGDIATMCGTCDQIFTTTHGPTMPPGISYIQARVPDHSNSTELVCPGSQAVININE